MRRVDVLNLRPREEMAEALAAPVVETQHARAVRVEGAAHGDHVEAVRDLDEPNGVDGCATGIDGEIDAGGAEPEAAYRQARGSRRHRTQVQVAVVVGVAPDAGAGDGELRAGDPGAGRVAHNGVDKSGRRGALRVQRR